MRYAVFLIGLVTAYGSVQAQPYTPDGHWLHIYSPSEDVHKLMFAVPDSNDSQVSIFCEPQSRKANFFFVAPDVDIRLYAPKIRTEKVQGFSQFDLEYNDAMGVYYVNQYYEPDSPFIVSLANSDDLLIDDARYRVKSPNEGRVIREFARACGAHL